MKETYNGYRNRVDIIGGLKEVPKLHETSRGGYAATIFLVTKYPSKNPVSGKFEDKTEWHAVEVYDDLAQRVVKKGRPGMRFAVSGTLHYETYEENGRSIKVVRIKANELEPMDLITKSHEKSSSPKKGEN